MSSFSKSNFNSEGYKQSRPQYPLEFYKHLQQYHNGKCDLIVDVGCGPGTATLQLSEVFNDTNEIIGTDYSERMIEAANNGNPAKNVNFHVAGGEDFTFLGERQNKRQCDMVVSAEAIQYFNLDKFQDEVHKNLRADGTLAYWGYLEPVVLELPAIDDALYDFCFGEEKLAPYWEKPAVDIIASYYRNIKLNDSLFKEVDLKVYNPREANYESAPFKMICEMTVQNLREYLQTWSIYYKWKHDPKNANKKDIIDEVIDKILENNYDLDTKIHVSWKTFYTFARAI